MLSIIQTVKLLKESKRLLHYVGLFDLHSTSVWYKLIKFVYIFLTTSYIIPMVCAWLAIQSDIHFNLQLPKNPIFFADCFCLQKFQ